MVLTKQGKRILIGIIGFIIFSIFMAHRNKNEYSELYKNGIICKAIVCDKKQSQNYTKYYFKFQVNSVGYKSIVNTTYRNTNLDIDYLELGDSILVIYDKEDPETNYDLRYIENNMTH